MRESVTPIAENESVQEIVASGEPNAAGNEQTAVASNVVFHGMTVRDGIYCIRKR